jgi:menaquinone-dependent protoporphyrinogen oxidase
MSEVLVAYATTYGSTREVAEAVATAISERGLPTVVRPVAEVKDLADYPAVVLGGPLYYFRWHKDARRLLARHHTALAARPVAIFALGPFNNDPDEFAGAREQLDKALEKHAWLAPVAATVFGGKFDPSALRFPHRLPGMVAIPESDIRDWDAIEAWAGSVAEAFGAAGD